APCDRRPRQSGGFGTPCPRPRAGRAHHRPARRAAVCAARRGPSGRRAGLMAVADGGVEPPDATIGSSSTRLLAGAAQRVRVLPAPLVLALLIGASAALRAWAG